MRRYNVERFIRKILALEMALTDLDNQRVTASAYVNLASLLLRYNRASRKRLMGVGR